MKLVEFEDIFGLNAFSEKDIVVREADEAFHANDKARCVDAIERLYSLLDDSLAIPYTGCRPCFS